MICGNCGVESESPSCVAAEDRDLRLVFPASISDLSIAGLLLLRARLERGNEVDVLPGLVGLGVLTAPGSISFLLRSVSSLMRSSSRQ